MISFILICVWVIIIGRSRAAQDWTPSGKNTNHKSLGNLFPLIPVIEGFLLSPDICSRVIFQPPVISTDCSRKARKILYTKTVIQAISGQAVFDWVWRDLKNKDFYSLGTNLRKLKQTKDSQEKIWNIWSCSTWFVCVLDIAWTTYSKQLVAF